MRLIGVVSMYLLPLKQGACSSENCKLSSHVFWVELTPYAFAGLSQGHHLLSRRPVIGLINPVIGLITERMPKSVELANGIPVRHSHSSRGIFPIIT